MSLLIAGELNWKCPFHFVRILGLHGVFAGAPQFACGFVFGGPSRDRAVLRARSVSSRHCWPLPGVGRDCCHGGALLFLSSARTLLGCGWALLCAAPGPGTPLWMEKEKARNGDPSGWEKGARTEFRFPPGMPSDLPPLAFECLLQTSVDWSTVCFIPAKGQLHFLKNSF